MKLIYCSNCQDIVRLYIDEERFCKCGECSGAYVDRINAWYKGNHAIPLGFHNMSFSVAISSQPEEGWGENFKAFVIPKECDTFIKKE
jgi:hypothetical protein